MRCLWATKTPPARARHAQTAESSTSSSRLLGGFDLCECDCFLPVFLADRAVGDDLLGVGADLLVEAFRHVVLLDQVGFLFAVFVDGDRHLTGAGRLEVALGAG